MPGKKRLAINKDENILTSQEIYNSLEKINESIASNKTVIENIQLNLPNDVLSLLQKDMELINVHLDKIVHTLSKIESE